MGLFKNLFRKKDEPQKTEPVKEPQKEEKAVRPAKKTDVKEVTAPTLSAKPTASKKTSSKKATAPKVTSPAKSASEKKPSAPEAVKLSSEPASKVTRPASSRSYFATTEEDLRIAFDEAIAEADAEIEKNGAKSVGKYEFELEVDGYHFYLIANNGQILFDSPSFTTLIGALNGIKTFKKAIATGNYSVRVDKYDRYRFIFGNKYYGENYTTKDQCVKCAESVQNFANNARIVYYKPDKEALMAYEAARTVKRVPEDIDWVAVEQAEKESPKMGKFEINREGDEYCFYLTANNGQILYASRYYSTESACRKGIDSFKRAAYVGNFFVDCDKFGNYRYVLKNIGSAPSFIGESYDNKPQCEKIIESVKNFIVTASIENSADGTAEN